MIPKELELALRLKADDAGITRAIAIYAATRFINENVYATDFGQIGDNLYYASVEGTGYPLEVEITKRTTQEVKATARSWEDMTTTHVVHENGAVVFKSIDNLELDFEAGTDV